MTAHSLAKAKRRRFTPIALTTGVLAAALLSVSMTGTLSGFVASINNSTNTTASGALIMQEQQTIGGTTTTCLSTDGGTINTNTATCATINKLGGTTNRLIPGQTVTQTVTITNLGNVTPTTFTLTPSACTQSTAGTPSGSATNLCAKINLVITQGAQTVYSGTAAAIGTTARAITASAAPNTTLTFTFAVTLDSSADNTYQNLQASMPLLWTYNA